ncbi:MAG: glycosyltransferase family 39 protein [Thermoleophilia bacterium]
MRAFRSDQQAPVAGLLLVAGAALAVRLPGLGVPDLVQAEHHKLEAVEAWRHGDMIVDGEHPALFKAVALVSTSILGDGAFALRLPNALAGAACCVLVTLIGRRLAGPVAGWAAGGLMALGTIPAAIDRVGKEDTLMLALALGAVLAWLGAEGRPRRWPLVAGLAGAAVAVKYEALPLLPLIWVAGRVGLGPRPPRLGRRALPAIGAFFAVHLALNPLLLWPAQVRFLVDFSTSLARGDPPPDDSLVPTHGFGAVGEIFDGKPVWYYALYLGLKAQPLWIALVVAGIGLAAARRRRSDLLLLGWGLGYVAVISAVPFGFARYLAPALPALALLGGAAVAAAWERLERAPATALAGAGALSLCWPLPAALPYPMLYVSALGGGSDRALYWTPDDAGGNLGMGAAVRAMVARGVPGRVAAADPTLVRFLSGGRLSAVAVEDLPPRPGALRAEDVRLVAVQPSQTTLGNRPLFDWLGRRARPELVVRVRGLEMVRLYRVDARGEPRSSTVTPDTTTARGKRDDSAPRSPGMPAKARPITTAPARPAARSTAARSSAPLPTRTSEASIVWGTALRPASSGISGRSLTTGSAGAVPPRTAAATRSASRRSAGSIRSRPLAARGTSSSIARPRAATAAGRGRGGTAEAASRPTATETRTQ